MIYLRSNLKSVRPSSAEGYQTNFDINESFFDEDKIPDYQELLSKDSEELFIPVCKSKIMCKPVRWPVECQCLNETIQHIYYVPLLKELLYCSTGKEERSQPIAPKEGSVLYRYPVSTLNQFRRSTANKYILPACPYSDPLCLKFESRYECGNLAKAVKVTFLCYELHLRPDLYTKRYSSWFYFRVTNMQKDYKYRLSIVNLAKFDSLYKQGLKPLMYSVRDAEKRKVGWRRCGENITYYSNKILKDVQEEYRKFHTLTFVVEFPHENDVVYFANCYPYSYTDLKRYLCKLSKHPLKSKYTSIRVLCKTLANNDLYYVTITSPLAKTKKTNSSVKEKTMIEKRAVIITARVHPSETPSSWIMKGFLDFLTSSKPTAKKLRDKYIFKLVPMLNPDGVIVGNARFSLRASDLNRQYRSPSRTSYPTIWYTKLLIERSLEKHGIAIYCDLHAHSKSHDIFLFGCENQPNMDKRLEEQVFAAMLQKNAANKFSLEKCKYNVEQTKVGTARVVMGMMGVPISFTMEASVGGSRLGIRKNTHFTVEDYEQMAYSFCETILDFYGNDPEIQRDKKTIEEGLRRNNAKKILKYIR
ncbi:hypothetical protein FQA39_LY02109 [Lamprigera yunnana]|nr:hypothetical protein FQA39_LY02109 [Lamprigera yunnana]